MVFTPVSNPHNEENSLYTTFPFTGYRQASP
ncbi:hypothetical protein GGE07_006086 [Sinorhizobium terangae]|nr:hypothetical protein [Sinorhizobium terangae]